MVSNQLDKKIEMLKVILNNINSMTVKNISISAELELFIRKISKTENKLIFENQLDEMLSKYRDNK